MEGALYSLAVAAIISIGSFVAGRFSVKTKSQVTLEKVCERVDQLEKSKPLELKCLLAILLALKRGKVNGECDEALDELNKYFCERK
jgi:hypothetical protein